MGRVRGSQFLLHFQRFSIMRFQAQCMVQSLLRLGEPRSRGQRRRQADPGVDEVRIAPRTIMPYMSL
jgi:hypothetical protein